MVSKQRNRWQTIRFGQWKRGRIDIVKHAEEYHERAPHPDGSGINETPFGREINGVPETEINRIHAEARKKLDELDREEWKDLGSKCWKIGAVEKPRLRAMAAEALLTGMHFSDPEDLEEYAEATGNSVIDAADELSKCGGFEEKSKGVVQPEIYWDEDDCPEDPDDDDPDGLEIYSVEA